MKRREFLTHTGFAAAAAAASVSGSVEKALAEPSKANESSTSSDVFSRGPHPVGIKTASWFDMARNRTLPVEIYYPATSANAGQDLNPAAQDQYKIDGDFTGAASKKQMAVRDAVAVDGDFPVIMYVHGFAGNRREFSYLCCYLASHGYRVVSADHIGSTFADIQKRFVTGTFNLKEMIPILAQDRYGDVPFILDKAEQEFHTKIKAAGCTGLSLGGWTTFCAPALDARIKAISPHCPGGVDGPLGTGSHNLLGKFNRFDWKSPAKMLTMVDDRDSWLPLYGQMDVFEKCPGDSNVLAVLKRADHQHFTGDMETSHNWFAKFHDQLIAGDKTPNGPHWAAIQQLIQPFSSLMPEPEAQMILCGFVTQHMNAHLKDINPLAASNIASLRQQAKQRNLGVYFLGALA